MSKLKEVFSTRKKAAVAIACIGIMLATLGACIAVLYHAGGTAGSSAIGGENAQNYAFADAGVDPVTAQAVRVKYGRFQGEFVYEVEFIAGDTQYAYKINAADGSVVKKESKTVQGPEASGPLPGTITLEEAREAALADAGLSREQATFTQAEQDEKGGIPMFAFKFFAGNVEYGYEINARTGAVYSKKTVTYVGQPAVPAQSQAPARSDPPTSEAPRPTQSAAPQPTATTPSQQPGGNQGYIGIDAARSAALAHAGAAADQVIFTEVRIDYKDGAAVYKLKFSKDRVEYKYEIDAATGAVLSSGRG